MCYSIVVVAIAVVILNCLAVVRVVREGGVVHVGGRELWGSLVCFGGWDLACFCGIQYVREGLNMCEESTRINERPWM